MNQSNDISEIIISTINSIFNKLFSSFDNDLYSILDSLIFISSDIINEKNFQKILGMSSAQGILLLANALLLAFILYYAVNLIFSYITFKKIETPFAFIFKLIIFGILMNSSFFILNILININSYITLAIKSLGESIFQKEISFSKLILHINSSLSSNSELNIFSLNGLIKSTISFSLLNLLFSYSLRYILIKIFILLSPFAFLSLSLNSSSAFFRNWLRNFFALLFIQHIVALILILLFSINLNSNNLLIKFIYLGGVYALVKSNSFVREFIGGVSTNVSQYVHNFYNTLK